MRTLRTSAGFPAMPPRKPEKEASAIREVKAGGCSRDDVKVLSSS